jgi:hypothetical protein
MSISNLLRTNSYNTTEKTLRLTGTQQAVSITTGAFVVDGGFGLSKNLYVGGVINTSLDTEPTAVNGSMFFDSVNKVLKVYADGWKTVTMT